MKLFRKLNQLTDFKYERYLPTAFDNSLSLLEKIDKVIEFLNVVIETTNKIGEYVEEKTNEQDNKIRDLRNEFENLKEYLLNGGLENDVVKVLNQWLADGTLADVINNEVFSMKADKTYVDNMENLFNRKFDDLGVNIVDYGAIPTEKSYNFDNTSIIQGVFDNLKKGQKVIIPEGTYMISNLKLEKDDVSIECFGALSQFQNSNGVALQIGKDKEPSYRVSGNINLRKQTRNWAQQNVGLMVRNMNEAILTIDVHDYTDNVIILGDEQGCSYNSFTIVNLKNGRNNLLFKKEGVGWVNENKFFGGRFQWHGGLDTDKVHINMPVGNNNIFFSPSLESTDKSTFIYCGGSYNTFYSPRLEGRHNGEIVYHLAEGAIYNQLIYPYYHGNLFDTNEVINNGSRNHIYGRDTLEFQDTQLRTLNLKIEGSLDRNLAWDVAGLLDIRSRVSNAQHLFHGRDAAGKETSYIDGFGTIKGREINGNNIIATPRTGSATEKVIEANDVEGNGIFRVTGDGTIRGKSRVNGNYNTFHFVPFAIKNTTGVTGTPKEYDGSDAIGVSVLNTVDNAIYVHMGSGNWKKMELT